MSDKMYKVVKHKGSVDLYLVYNAFSGWMWSVGDTCAFFQSRKAAQKVILEKGFTGCTIEPM